MERYAFIGVMVEVRKCVQTLTQASQGFELIGKENKQIKQNTIGSLRANLEFPMGLRDQGNQVGGCLDNDNLGSLLF